MLTRMNDNLKSTAIGAVIGFAFPVSFPGMVAIEYGVDPMAEYLSFDELDIGSPRAYFLLASTLTGALAGLIYNVVTAPRMQYAAPLEAREDEASDVVIDIHEDVHEDVHENDDKPQVNDSLFLFFLSESQLKKRSAHAQSGAAQQEAPRKNTLAH